MTHKTLYAVAFAAVTTSAVLTAPAHALTPEERDEARTEFRETRDTARADHQEARDAAREEHTEEREAARAEHKEDRVEKRTERAGERADRREDRFDTRWARMSEKLDNVVTRLSEAGADTTELVSAIATLESKANEVKEAFSAYDSALEGDDRDAVAAAKESVRIARDDMKSYFTETVRPLIKSLIDEVKSAQSNS